MGGLDELIACAGAWTGTNALQDPENGIEATAPSRASVTPLMDGRFVRIDYDWSYRDRPQWGSMLVGHRPDADEVTLYWIDSWHNGHSAMLCRGTRRDGGVLDVRGTYGVGTGPDWGWRTEIHPHADSLLWVMYNVTPAGEEALAVEEMLARA